MFSIHIVQDGTDGDRSGLDEQGGDVRRRSQSVSPRLGSERVENDIIATLSSQRFVHLGNSGETRRRAKSLPLSPLESSSLDSAKTDVNSSEDDSFEVKFSCGNPRVEVTHGVMKLYRDSSAITWENGRPSVSRVRKRPTLPEKRSSLLCIFGVPNFVSGSELCKLLEPFEAGIEHLRIVRRKKSSPWYLCMVKCFSQEAADSLFLDLNQRPYNSLEPEICNLLFVSEVRVTSGDVVVDNSFPQSPEGTTELPTCPVCLERLDSSISGILTILCNHSFHCRCMARWHDSSCPVCRCLQQPAPEAQQCVVCGRTDSLWMCLICGFVGCGRYAEKHAKAHFLETQHTFSVELGTQRVWDYVGDGYVHRLIQDKKDGMVEVEERPTEERKSKLEESFVAEYNYLLTSQLEAQRLYFEEKLTEVRERAEKERQETKRRITKLEKDKRESHRRWEKSQEEKELLRQLNEQLIVNQKEYQQLLAAEKTEHEKDVTQKDVRLKELEEQVRDMMLHFSASAEIAKHDDWSQGEISVPSVHSEPSRSGRRKSRR